MSLFEIKYCKKCEEAFDIGINYDICPSCRGVIKFGGVKEDGERFK